MWKYDIESNDISWSSGFFHYVILANNHHLALILMLLEASFSKMTHTNEIMTK